MDRGTSGKAGEEVAAPVGGMDAGDVHIPLVQAEVVVEGVRRQFVGDE